MARTLWKTLARRVGAAGRRLQPPGNRVPIDESREQHPGPGSGGVPSPAGQKSHTLDQWQGGP